MRLDDDLKYFEEPEFKAILSKYEAAREVGASVYMDADELTDIAEYYSMVQHDDDRSNEVIDFALQLHPDAVDPQIFKARQLMLKGDTDGARTLCDAIDDQQHREVYFLRAELLVRDQLFQEALTYLEEAVENITEDKDYFLYDAAYIFIDYRQFSLALTFAKKLVEMAPDWYKTWELNADCYLGLENNLMALEYIERMLDVDPFCTDAWNWSAEAQCGMGDFGEAMVSLEYSLALDPQNERALQLKAWVLLQQGNFTEAHKLYQQMIDKSPDNEQNWLFDSYCLLDANKMKEALASIERAEKLSDGMSAEQSTIYEQHAQILSRMGQWEQALEYVDMSELSDTSYRGGVDYDLFRARIYCENNKLQEALSWIEQAVNSTELEDKPQTYYRGAQILFDLGYGDVAAEIFSDVLQHTDSAVLKAECHAYLAFNLMFTDQDDKVYEHLTAALPEGESKLKELFSEEYPNVAPTDYYSYYYYRVHGEWPNL